MRISVVLVLLLITSSSLSSQSNLYLRSGNPVNEFSRMPVFISSQMYFSGMVDNLGDSAATNVRVVARVYNSASTLVYTDSSATVPNLSAGDSLQFTIASFQLPPVTDSYVIQFIATQSNVDADPADNIKELRDTFYVTDTVLARDNNNFYLPIATAGNAGGFLGNQFVSSQPAMITSISGYLYSSQPCSVAFALFSYNNGSPGNIPLATSDVVTLGAFPLWTTLPFQNGPVYVGIDTFIIAAQQFSSAFIDLGLSDGNYSAGTTWVKWPALGGWQNIEIFGDQYAYPFMLRANLTEATSIEENPSNDLPEIYPNPALTSVTITGAGNETIEITNALGQIVYSTKAIGTSTAVDVTKFEAGVYLVSVYSEDKKTTQRLIIE